METPKERQAAEYEMLQSIYDRDVFADETAEWLDVSLFLGPLHDSRNPDVHATIVLRVKCDQYYPDSEPVIKLSDSKGLSRVQVEELQQQLIQLAVRLRGEVMILELAQCVQEFLHRHNKPAAKSFYDEMVQRQLQQEQLRHQTEIDKKIEEIRDIREKVSIKEALAPLSSDEGGLSASDDEEHGIISEKKVMRVRFAPRVSLSSVDTDCAHRSCKYLQFGSKVLRGRCLEHGEHSVVYFAIDVSNGDPNLVREYNLKPAENQTSKQLLSNVLKQLDSIEKETQYLKRFRHENIVSYLDFKYIVERDHIVTYLLQEFASNVTLASYGSWDVAPDIGFIRHMLIGILRALAFLHQHNVLHKNINSAAVYFSKTGLVKLADFSVQRRLEELQFSCTQIQQAGGRSKSSRAADVLQLAGLVLGLLGVVTDSGHFSELPEIVPQDLKDFLEKCCMPEERRWTARQLLEHEFVQDSVPRECWMRMRRSSGALVATNVVEDEEETTDQLMSQFKIPKDLKSQSRLSSEFRVLKYLGSGSFGKVLKAKNRLDGGIYAIKAIELNPKNKHLNRKMIREVKLLSKLNHENVVRYFNSWIETTNVDDSSSVTQVTSTPLQSLTEAQSFRTFDPNSGLSRRNGVHEEEEYEDDDLDEEDGDTSDDSNESPTKPMSRIKREELSGGYSLINADEDTHLTYSDIELSESVVFEDSGGGIHGLRDSAVEVESPQMDSTASTAKQLRYLYIQMEFCEKSTLRIAIDQGALCEDSQRYWRLVREIVEGLAYIHQQDMIHRDLKPVNIFLDSSDHVKIGDFGLATMSVLNRNNMILTMMNQAGMESESSSHLHTEDSHTGGVGTSFYVAPELQKQIGKTHYNKKVDIYSLGIILFEMAHPPFTTHMERCKTLSNLRLSDIVMPPHFDQHKSAVVLLVRLLLSHDPSKRPSCSELLTSTLLPPPQVEDSEVQDFIRHTLSNPQSKAYKYLISSCFRQIARVEDDLTYHPDVLGSERHYVLQERARDAVVKIVRRHGATCVPTPLLTPDAGQDVGGDTGVVRLMTHSGSVVSVPRDLRIPFARQLARTGTQYMRRYSVERVYRERRTHGYHPREASECAFDIVTPTAGYLTADAEMLAVLQEVHNELPVLKGRNCTIRVNHALLLRAVLLALGVNKLYTAVFQVLYEARESKISRTRLESSLESVSVNGQQAVTLAGLFLKEDVLNKVSSEVIPLVRRNEEALNLAKKAFEQLKIIISHAETMGNKIPVRVCIGVVTTSPLCTGLMFDITYAVRQKRKDSYDVLAAGCRYDGLVVSFRSKFDVARSSWELNPQQTAVGMSISLDKLVTAIKDDDDEELSEVNVAVCSLGQDTMLRAKADLVRALWASGVTCHALESLKTLEDLEIYGRDHHMSHLVWLKESERGIARVRSWERERERYIEKKMAVGEVVDHLMRNTRLAADADVTSRAVSVDSPASQVLNIHILVEDKIAAAARRRYETQIKSKLINFLGRFSSRPMIEVLGLFLELRIIKLIAANVDFSDDTLDLSLNTQLMLDKCTKNKKYLQKVLDKVHSLCAEKANVVVILYSLIDDKFKQIL